jgi:hypothetical protein
LRGSFEGGSEVRRVHIAKSDNLHFGTAKSALEEAGTPEPQANQAQNDALIGAP